MVLAQFLVLGSVKGVDLQEAELTTIKNIVERDEGAGAQPAKANDKIREKSKVTTAAASMAELTFADSSITRMGANTLFSFQSKERLIKLDQGTVLMNTPPGNGGATVDCGGVTASVTGTTFMASRDKVGNSVFVLLEGSGGMKITVGGTSTTIRPGQAASVGASTVADAGAKTEDKATVGPKAEGPSGGKEAGSGKEPDPAGKPAADSPSPGGGRANGDKPLAAGAPASGNTGGETGGGAKSPAPAAAPTPPAAPKNVPVIKVFEVDVKKVVQTTPLITGFKNELPSAKKIEATIQVQQAKVAEGKIEKLEVEVVAVSHGDGDLLVGAPVVQKEDMQIVNSKETVAEKGENRPADMAAAPGSKDSMDIATAAGPDAGAARPPPAAAPPPPMEAPAPPPPVVAFNPVNPAQIVVNVGTTDSTAALPKIALTVRANDASRTFGEANPAFGFNITAGSLSAGHNLVATFLTPATSGSPVSGGPYPINVSSVSIVNNTGVDVTSQYDISTLGGVLNVLKATPNLNFAAIAPRLTGSSGVIPIPTVQAGGVSLAVLEADGRAAVDALGNLTVGKILGADAFTIRAAFAGNENYFSGQRDVSVGITPDGNAILAANPARRMLMPATAGDELAALDQFFYYTGKVAGGQGPATFFETDHRNATLDLTSLGSSVQLFAGQTSDYYFGGRLELSQPTATFNLNARDVVLYGNRVSFSPAAIAPVSANLINLNNSATFASATPIPDGNPAGLTQTLVNSQISPLPYAVRLNLNINPDAVAGAFLGDYVAYLRHTSADGLDSRTVRLFEHIGATTANPDGSAGTGMSVLLSDWATDSIALQDPANQLTGSYRPEVTGQQMTLNDLGGFDPSGSWTLFVGDTSSGGVGVLGGWSVQLEQLLQPQKEINLVEGPGKTVTIASGDEGMDFQSTWIKATQANLKFMSTGSLAMGSTQIDGAGSQFLAEAVGTVKMGAQSTIAVPSPSPEAVDREQVRILSDTVTDAGGVQVAAPGSMAVIRTGDSLELRNVTIRNFEGTTLERVKDGVTTGRVLMSGSMVRDFKIKELVGAAVNADAKIQMMAMNGNGALAGTMAVEGSLPVATKLASALAAVNESLPSETANAQVHASEINLSADRLNFQNNANLVAMNAITARANTILVQNSFMTVVRNSGMINMYVQSGLVNQSYGSVVAGQLNFAGISNFRIGNVVNFTIANSGDIASAMSSGQLQQVSAPEAGKVNVLKL